MVPILKNVYYACVERNYKYFNLPAYIVMSCIQLNKPGLELRLSV